MKKELPLVRIEFVGMLFALAIGQVAIEFIKVIESSSPWSLGYYSISHLVLSTSIICLSWVGWQSSKSLGNLLNIHSLFSVPFLILLLDVLLVIFYYAIANGNEKLMEDGINFSPPDAGNETKWVMWIFIVYLVWDFFTKVLVVRFREIEGKTNTYGRYLKFSLRDIKRVIITLICLGVSVYMFIVYKGDNLNGLQVLVIDINLLLIFVAFRGFKQSYSGEYSIAENQIPDQIIQESNIKFLQNDDEPSKINVISKKGIGVKILLVRYMPIVLFFILELLNHCYFA